MKSSKTPVYKKTGNIVIAVPTETSDAGDTLTKAMEKWSTLEDFIIGDEENHPLGTVKRIVISNKTSVYLCFTGQRKNDSIKHYAAALRMAVRKVVKENDGKVIHINKASELDWDSNVSYWLKEFESKYRVEFDVCSAAA